MDPQRNQVVVQAGKGRAAELSTLLARYGDAVRVEEAASAAAELTAAPTSGAAAEPTAQSYLRGGDAFDGCSVGFNVTKGGVGHFLTAGHCGQAGGIASSGGIPIGPFVESSFPAYDDALVRNDNPSYWVQGPWVNAYTSDPNAVYLISGYKDSPVGVAVCKSARTTGVTCGLIRAKDVTVNYGEGAVFGLTQHSACYEAGDGGGALFSGAGGLNYAEGIISGGLLRNGHCLETVGQESVTYANPIADSIAYYGVTLTTA